MFAIVRTGGKQYRVAPGDKIVVEKLAGETGDTVNLSDVLLAGAGSDLMATAGLIVGAEIVAQAKSEKVTVFKKRRRHNYRRKAGHRQQLTILKIVSIGDHKGEQATAPAAAAAPVASEAPAPAPKAKAAKPAPVATEASTSDAAPAKAPTKKAAPKAAAKTEEK
jgi:large subunit ribosomal protein L21